MRLFYSTTDGHIIRMIHKDSIPDNVQSGEAMITTELSQEDFANKKIDVATKQAVPKDYYKFYINGQEVVHEEHIQVTLNTDITLKLEFYDGKDDTLWPSDFIVSYSVAKAVPGIDFPPPEKFGNINLVGGSKEVTFNTGVTKQAMYLTVPEHTIIIMII